MPRFYFNVYDGQDRIDRDGIDLPGLNEMRLRMVTQAAAILGAYRAPEEVWLMEALNEEGEIVGTIEFGLTREDGPIRLKT